MIRYLIILILILTSICTASENKIVYTEEGKFCGWPANEGIWSWGDEILVGFNIGQYKHDDPGHDCNLAGFIGTVQARSLDGGNIWTIEMPHVLDLRKGAKLKEKINFLHPDFAMKLRDSVLWYSYDRGKNWNGPYEIANFNKNNLRCRTDYIINSKDECIAFVTSQKPDDIEGFVYAIKTTDGGLNFDFLSYIAPMPPLGGEHNFSVQPSTVKISDKKLITSVRERRGKQKWVDVYESNDNGANWKLLSTPVPKGNSCNPPHLLKLKDGRICLTYGRRIEPYGITAKLSSDNGKTWSKEIILRDDGREWDLGYTRNVQRTDGKVVTVYYYTTKENERQHIAATIWDPSGNE
ncbi:MAG TPA: hypothetical protein DDX75_05590 [Phycisphaerales bacterium]|nr:hypothetical protein [Phycisphaerales bacterium]